MRNQPSLPEATIISNKAAWQTQTITYNNLTFLPLFWRHAAHHLHLLLPRHTTALLRVEKERKKNAAALQDTAVPATYRLGGDAPPRLARMPFARSA